jgi:hypothetical protein
MFPATVGFLSLVAVVFFFGVLSARNASRHRSEERSVPSQPSDSPVSRNRRNQDDENPAMAMAGATKNNLNPETQQLRRAQ